MRKRVIESLVCYRGKVYDEGDKEVATLVDEEIVWMRKQKEQKQDLPLMGGDADTYFDDLRMTTKPLTSREWFEEGIRYAQRLQKEQKPASISISCGRENDKPAEWSEEDEKRLNAIVELLENTSAIHPNYSRRRLIIWLKSLRPSWKPSEEQMKALQWWAELPICSPGLKSLYEDLKKL